LHHEVFTDIIKNELCGKNINGMKWDDLILRFEWKVDIKSALINSGSESQGAVDLVMQMAAQYPC